MTGKEQSYCVGDWLAIKDMAKLLPKTIAAAIPKAMEAQESRLQILFAMGVRAQQRVGNKPLTLLLKNSPNVLVHSGTLVRGAYLKVLKAEGGAIWGVSKATRIGNASKTTTLKTMADLILWLNGSDDLNKPRMRLVTVSAKAAKLFATVAGAIRAREGRTGGKRKKGGKAPRQLTGRARQIFDALRKSRGASDFRPPKAGTTMVIPPRYPFLEAFRHGRPVFTDIALHAVAGGVMDALAQAQARYQRETTGVWGHGPNKGMTTRQARMRK